MATNAFYRQKLTWRANYERKQTLTGTAREHFEIKKYFALVKKYSEPTAKDLIKGQLANRNITTEEFDIYLKVKQVVQNEGLDVGEAQREAEQMANAIFR